MPGSQKLPTRITRVTAASARYGNERELAEIISKLVNALQGEWGYGDWDGGVGGVGFWQKSCISWSCQTLFTATGSVNIELPYTANNAVLEVIDTATGTQSLFFIESDTSATITANGQTLVRIQDAQIGE